MSHSHVAAASSSNFQLIINNALEAYKKRTKIDLLAHPLAPQSQACDSPGAILAVLQQQVRVQGLDTTVNVLFTFSAMLGPGIGMVCSRTCAYLHSYISLAGIFPHGSNLCRYRCSPFSKYPQQLGMGRYSIHNFQTAKDVRASQDTLMDIFGKIEMFFRRLEVYADVSPTTEMVHTIILIVVEVLSILGIATKEIRRGRMREQFIMSMSPLTKRCSETFVKKLIGRTDMEDALKRLDKLTQEEARMAVAQNLKATHTVDERVRGVANTVVAIEDQVTGVDDRVAGVDVQVATVDDRVARVNDIVASVDNNMASVDAKVANDNDMVAYVDDNLNSIDAKDRVAIVDDSVKVVDDKVTEVIHGTEVTANDVDPAKRMSSPSILTFHR